MSIVDKFVHKEFINKELKYSEVYYYLDKYNTTHMFSIVELQGTPTIKKNYTIWVMWLQGMHKAPKLVKKCYESICKNKPDEFDVVLLTEENLKMYIQLPDFIWEKYNRGYISKTHLSDLIRLELLCTYGGAWIDATVYCSDSIPTYMLSGEMFLFKSYSNGCEMVIKMSSWWMYAYCQNRIIHATRNMILNYWKNENKLKDYFLLHIIMSKIIDEDAESKKIFDSIPYFNNGNPHVLQAKLPLKFNEEEWTIIKNASVIHKLTYKSKIMQGDIYNYYMALLEDKLES